MKFFQHFSSFLPSFTRDRVSEDIAQLKSELIKNVIPTYKTAMSTVANHPFQSNEVIGFNNAFHNAVPDLKRYNFIESSFRVFSALPAALDMLQLMIDGNFSEDIAKDALTYRKANIIRYLEIGRFAVDYGMRSLIYYTAFETAAVLHKEAPEVTPADKVYMDSNFRDFFATMVILDKPLSVLKHTLETIPDITMQGDKVNIVKQTVGENKVDPFKMGLISAAKNPIYHIRLALAEWQVDKYKAKVEEKRQLEYRLLALKDAYQGKQNPSLQRSIEYSQGRLQRLNFEIQEKAAEYA